MTWELARPSFWSEPRDPWAWQRALRRLATLDVVPDPWPCWEHHLRDILARRAVGGLYGLKVLGNRKCMLGAELLVQGARGWSIATEARQLVDAPRDRFQRDLAEWIVRRSVWVRLTLRRLAAGRWSLPKGSTLDARHSLRIGVDLIIDHPGPDPGDRVGELAEAPCVAHVEGRELSPLYAPVYLLASLGWINGDGRPQLPEPLSAGLIHATPAAALRELTTDQADRSGFVPIEAMARGLWTRMHGRGGPPSLAQWTDAVFGAAIASGAIEIHAWAPGQPRHGRGLFGDRNRKLVRWTVHDDFTSSLAATSPPEVDR